MLCIRTRDARKQESSEGTEIPEIGDFKESPESFFAFHTCELNSEIIGVRERMELASSGVISSGKRGKERTSTALLP